MTSRVPLAVLPPGSVRTVPVPMLEMLPKSFSDVWLIAHFWVAAPVHAHAAGPQGDRADGPDVEA
jgi:hypothetical protein